jgi:hypothetical protein
MKRSGTKPLRLRVHSRRGFQISKHLVVERLVERTGKYDNGAVLAEYKKRHTHEPDNWDWSGWGAPCTFATLLKSAMKDIELHYSIRGSARTWLKEQGVL